MQWAMIPRFHRAEGEALAFGWGLFPSRAVWEKGLDLLVVAFSAGGDGGGRSSEHPTTTHRSFATASHRRQSILGPPEKCGVAHTSFPVPAPLKSGPGDIDLSGRSRHEVKQVYIRFCFPDAATAEAFRNRFGGECL